jgi:hypothetical protein
LKGKYTMTTSYTRDRGFTKARDNRRIGKDAEIRDMLDDEDADFGDLVAACIDAAPPEHQAEVFEALREMGEDRRGPRSWAADRLERRSLRRASDARLKRMGRDDPVPFKGMPETGGGMVEGEDRRRMAGDAALARSPHGRFDRMFPNASKVERA